MKYRMLTNEEMEGLKDEFIKFLVVNGMDANMWQEMKASQVDKAEGVLISFSDFILENVLNKIQYMDYNDTHNMLAFQCNKDSIVLIGLESEEAYEKHDDMLQGLVSKPTTFKIYKEEKNYHPDRNTELFRMAESGAKITDSQIFDFLNKFVD